MADSRSSDQRPSGEQSIPLSETEASVDDATSDAPEATAQETAEDGGGASTISATDTAHANAVTDRRGGKRPSRRRRWPLIMAAVLVPCAIAGAAVAGFAYAGAQTRTEAELTTKKPTVSVTRGDVTVETRTTGTLIFEGQSSLLGGPAGTLTSLPAVGTVISRGQSLYEVNTKPVMLLNGTLPAWRDFGPGMGKGTDVRQLEQNLDALGFFSGTIDDEFTAKTEEAIRAWQKDFGMPVTGTLSRTDVLFLPNSIRVAETKARVGQQVAEGTELMTTSSTNKVVTVDLKPAQRSMAQLNAPVTISLPSGQSTPGTVASVGASVERAGKDGSSSTTIIPVTVALADQGTTATLDRAGVQVLFTTSSSKDVLTVPVEALVPLNDSAFGVETPDDKAASGIRRIPVTLGAFGAGRVAVSGDGIAEGLKVVVPEAVSGP